MLRPSTLLRTVALLALLFIRPAEADPPDPLSHLGRSLANRAARMNIKDINDKVLDDVNKLKRNYGSAKVCHPTHIPPPHQSDACRADAWFP